jgi:hypothetical protein
VSGPVHNTLYDTYPLAVHAPQAAECPWWEIVAAECLTDERRYAPREDLAIVTWNSGDANADLEVRGHSLGVFERSVENCGLRCQVLGSGIGSAWSNLMKLDLMIDFLEQAEARYVLAADSTDALLVGDPGEILRRFLTGEADVVFNGEKNCWPPDLPDLQEWEEEIGQPPFTYLNAGLWIGRREACLDLYYLARRWSEKLDSHPHCDQTRLKLAYRELYPGVVVDHRCEMFQNINRVGGEITVAGKSTPSRLRRFMARRAIRRAAW